MNKKIGVTGARGYIGQSLMRHENMIPIETDIRDEQKLKMEIESKRPDLIVHLAAITDPDKCQNPKNETLVRDVNLVGTFNVGNICNHMGIGMVFMSSFQVFSGKGLIFRSAYTEKDLPAPVNYYGLSKLTGESYQQVYNGMKIIRAPYIFDWGRMANHINALEHRATEHPTFMKRSFMHIDHFIESLLHYIDNFDRMPLVLNISTIDTVSWYGFMCEVADALFLEHAVLPRNKELEFTTPKPHKAGLNPSASYKLGFPQYSSMDGIQLLQEGI